ncbi:MAG: YqgE/AlgH family protein [Gammaproteobacteria bacterium]|nr:YqgE/AlgH family protein [Gammaproteobacteria bacterium]
MTPSLFPARTWFRPVLLVLLLAACSLARSETARTPETGGAAPERSAAVPAAEGARIAHPRLDKGIFLIARQGLDDPNFSRSVILITQYDDAGTVGLVINRTLPVLAVEAVPPIARLGLDPGELRAGGPVAIDSLQLLIRAAAGMDDSLRILDDIYLISEAAALEKLLQGGVTGHALRLYAGYAGWGPGQLESELLRGDWHLWPADPAEIFSASPDTIWPKLIQLAAAQWARLAAPFPAVTHLTRRSIMAGHLTRAQPSAGRDRAFAGRPHPRCHQPANPIPHSSHAEQILH